MGIIYFLLYYSSFKYLILKYNLKTLGRSNNGKLLLQQDEKNFDVLTAIILLLNYNTLYILHNYTLTHKKRQNLMILHYFY